MFYTEIEKLIERERERERDNFCVSNESASFAKFPANSAIVLNKENSAKMTIKI